MLGPLSLLGLQHQFVTKDDTGHFLFFQSRETISWNPVTVAHARKDRGFFFVLGSILFRGGHRGALRGSEFF